MKMGEYLLWETFAESFMSCQKMLRRPLPEVHAPGPTVFEFQNKNDAIILYTFRTISSNRTRILYTFSFPGDWKHVARHLRILKKNYALILYTFHTIELEFFTPSPFHGIHNSCSAQGSKGANTNPRRRNAQKARKKEDFSQMHTKQNR